MFNRHPKLKPAESKIIATNELWKRLEIGTVVVNAKELIEQGADLASLNQSGLTPIEFAAYKKLWLEVVIIANRKKTDTRDSYHYNAALDEAIKHKHFFAIQKLLSAGAKIKNIDLIDEAGNTLLHKAVEGIFPHLVELLIQSGANVSIKNKNGKTPLHLATSAHCLMAFLTINPHPEEFKDFNYYSETILMTLDNLVLDREKVHFHWYLPVEDIDKLLNARINNNDEQTILDQQVNNKINNLLQKVILSKRSPSDALLLIKLGARHVSNDEDYISLINQISFKLRFKNLFSISSHLEELLIRLLATQTLPSADITKHLLLLKPNIYLKIKNLQNERISTASYVSILHAAIDQTNALGQLMHLKQGLLNSDTVKKIAKEIKAHQQKHLSLDTSKIQMWSPPKLVSAKQAKALQEKQERMFQI